MIDSIKFPPIDHAVIEQIKQAITLASITATQNMVNCGALRGEAYVATLILAQAKSLAVSLACLRVVSDSPERAIEATSALIASLLAYMLDHPQAGRTRIESAIELAGAFKTGADHALAMLESKTNTSH